ncbi:hypothetical protein OS176_10535 [Xanthomonadaceae bacterium XH05]|nr:hypothetical protein [Xanthomonadaceae bacterium XH05]
MNILPTSIPSRRAALALACCLGLSMGLPVQAAGQGVESWREFARRNMMPDYSWNDAPSAQDLAPTLRKAALGARANAITLSFSAARSGVQRSLTVALDATVDTGAASGSVMSAGVPDFQSRLSPMSSQLLGTTFEQDAGAYGRLGVSALIAQQQFATPGFGLAMGFQQPSLTRKDRVTETAAGHGVRLDYRLPMGERFAWRWAAQSKLEMDTFDSVYGIHAEPGDFDLPARFGMQMEWFVRKNFALALGMERVYYGDISPFTSAALPARLLSLMADGGAPSFAWQDLTVYSAESRLSDRWQGQWMLRYTTRQQPSPTAELYRRAIESEYAGTNFTLGYRRGLNGWGEMAFTASYAPSMAFLGPGPVFTPRTFSRGAVAEFEAFWIVPLSL